MCLLQVRDGEVPGARPGAERRPVPAVREALPAHRGLPLPGRAANEPSRSCTLPGEGPY